MGDTVTITVTEEWQEFFSNIGESFTFSNQGPSIVFVRESATKPDKEERGYTFVPHDSVGPGVSGGAGTVESSPFWVRAVESAGSKKSFFHFGTVVAGAGGGAGAFPIGSITSDPKNLVITDDLTFFVVNSPGAITINIPDNVDEAFPIGAEMEFIREGVGTVTFAAPGVANLESRAGLVTINAQYSAVTLKKIGLDEWRLIGDLA
jgi:hypothetical protein